MEHEKKNTIRILFGVGQRKPKDAEVFQFFNKNGWKCEELTAMYREDRSVYVKFKSMDLMRKAILRLGSETTFRYADGTTTEVMVMEAGGVIKYVRIFGLNPEIGDEEIRVEMGKYGKIKQLCRERFAAEFGFPIWNGVRGIFMEIEKDLPPQIKILGKNGRVYYDGLRDKCFGCGSEGHLKVNCTERSSVGASPLANQSSSSLAQVVANGTPALQPIEILEAKSINNQAGKGKNESNELKKKSDEGMEMIREEVKALAGSGQGSEHQVNTNVQKVVLSESSLNPGTVKPAEIYRRPWPRYR